MKKSLLCILLPVCLAVVTLSAIAQKKEIRPRVIVTSDGEVDDMDSFIRFLLYTNEINVVGMVYSSSEFHYAGDGKGTTFTSKMPFAKGYGTRRTLRWLGTSWMQDFIDKYATVYPNLLKHDKNYPSPQHLKSLVKVGNIDFEGEMDHNTAGSDFIKGILLDENPEPVYLPIWGGTNTIARALKSIEEEYKGKPQWDAIYKKVSAKTTLYVILDQDDTYKKYVSVNWPDLKVIFNGATFWCLAYPWNRMVPAQSLQYLDGPWYKEHIKFDHGALTGSYFLWGDGQKLAADSDHTQGDPAEAAKKGMKQYAFISEGDSPSYFYLINTGLRSAENPSYGGWGGRFKQSDSNPHLYKDGAGAADYNFYTKKDDNQFAQTLCVDALQNDFAARADWCVKPYNQANHPPVVTLTSKKDVSAKPGAVVKLVGAAKDPDGNSVAYKWWQYKEAGTYNGNVSVDNADKANASFTVPADAKPGKTIHIIFEVTDNGSPALTRYQRVIVTVAA